MTIQMPTVIVDSGASVDDREDSMQMLREQIHAQQAEIKALRTALMYKSTEQDVLNAFERGQAFGYAEGLKKAQEK